MMRIDAMSAVCKSLLAVSVGLLAVSCSVAGQPEVLFDGSNTDGFEFNEGSWVIDDDGSLTCRMEQVKQKNGQLRTRGMGYLWTRKDYENFELTLAYKLSVEANSGVFYRTDPTNPVQGGFEIQLADDEGFQKSKGKKDPKNLNGAFYDCKAALAKPAKPVGSWNRMRLRCEGSSIRVEINDVLVVDVNVDDWDTPGMNPDGSSNKFKTALKDLPRIGRIGFQNHGQVVWFKDVTVRPL
jgi:hypothetical protein